MIYVLYSASADKYYVGHTDNPSRRVEEHNTAVKNSYTSKYRPWIMKSCFLVSESRSHARMIENYLKRMKSRSLIEVLIARPEKFDEILRKVRAIPKNRD